MLLDNAFGGHDTSDLNKYLWVLLSCIKNLVLSGCQSSLPICLRARLQNHDFGKIYHHPINWYHLKTIFQSVRFTSKYVEPWSTCVLLYLRDIVHKPVGTFSIGPMEHMYRTGSMEFHFCLDDCHVRSFYV